MSSDSSEVGDGRWRGFCEALSTEAKFGVEFGLEPMREALSAEGHPERSSTAVLVAGTNGKGGTAAYISGVLQAHGRRVGLYTSPHLIDPAERFRVDGRPLSRRRILQHAEPILDDYGDGGEGDPSLTYFELTTLIAARLFDATDVDVAVYEVGLGGRLDAVNAIDPDVSVITCIDTDHTTYLGEDIAEIAREKCGIARAGRPLIVGRQTHPEVPDIFPECAPEADLELHGRDYDDAAVEALTAGETSPGAASLPWTKRTNAATAIRAAERVLGDEYTDRRAAEGVRRTRWPGRFDWRTIPPDFSGAETGVRALFDAAHNPGAVDTLFEQLDGWPKAYAGVVCGGMADKDLEGMFGRLDGGPPVWGVTLPTDRSADSERLRRVVPERRLVEVTDAASALRAAARRADEQNGQLLVFGSVFLVGACFRAVGVRARDLTVFAGPGADPV